MSARTIDRVALAGDADGIPDLLRNVPVDRVACLIAASRRPQYLDALSKLAVRIGKPLLIQPAATDLQYRDFVSGFESARIDFLICNSYSMLLPPDLLSRIEYRAINVHAALLPRNRGPNPIQWAIIRGEERTGVTLHFMSDRFDEGDIVAQRPVDILPSDTWVSLSLRMKTAAAALLQSEVPAILRGKFSRITQNSALATRNPRLNANSPRIDFDKMSDQEVCNLIRAQVAPLEGAYLDLGERRIRFPQMLSLKEVAALRQQYGTASPKKK
jgi:methionyl-tRNA formyltransferase